MQPLGVTASLVDGSVNTAILVVHPDATFVALLGCQASSSADLLLMATERSAVPVMNSSQLLVMCQR